MWTQEKEDILQILDDNNITWNDFYGKTILITGATGLIGSLCIKSLLALEKAPKIIAFVRDLDKGKAMFGNQVDYLVGDIRKSIPHSYPVDYIIHCASVTASKTMITAPVDTMTISYLGTMNVMEFARESQVKGVVYISSMEVYGETEEVQNPITEEKLGYINLSRPRSTYPEGKRACELLCYAYYAQYKVPVKIARLAQTFGAGIPKSDNRMSMQFAKSIVQNEDICLHTKGNSLSNYCYSVDAIRGIFTILLKGEDGEAYNVCNDKETRSVSEIAMLVAEKIGKNQIRVIYDIPENNVFGYAPDSKMRLCSDKLNRLGWTASVSMKEGYGRLVRYLQEKYN